MHSNGPPSLLTFPWKGEVDRAKRDREGLKLPVSRHPARLRSAKASAPPLEGEGDDRA